ncbi:MAG: DNA polymerase I, partial [Parcubacteria group bacterium]|nr:DNA polymerase I [Parcubacteria group bacterium]
GMGSGALSRNLEISRAEAKDFIDKYFKTFPSIKKYTEETLKFANKNGYVETQLGRRRYLPELSANQPMLKAAAERMAVNMPLQGTAADIIKLAMIKIVNKFNLVEGNSDLRMILQVHDELIFEIKEDKLEEYAKEIKDIMENIYKLDIPLKVDMEVGNSWGRMEDLKI